MFPTHQRTTTGASAVRAPKSRPTTSNFPIPKPRSRSAEKNNSLHKSPNHNKPAPSILDHNEVRSKYNLSTSAAKNRDYQILCTEIDILKKENVKLKEKVGYIEQLSEDKDQRIQDLYEIISSMGDRLTDLIKGEILNNRETNKKEWQEVIEDRFSEFEQQMA